MININAYPNETDIENNILQYIKAVKNGYKIEKSSNIKMKKVLSKSNPLFKNSLFVSYQKSKSQFHPQILKSLYSTLIV